jgi:FixJ family two-component response regulator
MPIMGGKELADRLVAESAVGSVLYTSGYTEAASPRFGQLHSGGEFMPKPFTPKTLIRRVRETLDASRLKASQDDGARERINTKRRCVIWGRRMDGCVILRPAQP